METEQSLSAVECIQTRDPSCSAWVIYSCGVLSLPESLHMLMVRGHSQLQVQEDVTQTPLGQTLSSHLLQWWQAGLEDCFDHSYSFLSSICSHSPPLDMDLDIFCSVSGSHDIPFPPIYYYVHMGGPGLPLEHLL